MAVEFTIGVDISKDHLDAFSLPDNRSKQFTNTQDGFRALIEWMGHQSVGRIRGRDKITAKSNGTLDET